MSQINSSLAPHREANPSHQQHLINHSFLSYNMPATTMPINDAHYFQPHSSISRSVPQLFSISEEHEHILPSSYSANYTSQGYGYPYGMNIPPSSYVIGNQAPLNTCSRQMITSEHSFQTDETPNQCNAPTFQENFSTPEAPSPQVSNPKITSAKKRKESKSQEEFKKSSNIKSPNNPSLSVSNVNQIAQMKEPKNCDNISTSKNESSSLMYPAHFMKGSIIQLAQGQLKRVEDMKTEDFIDCTKNSPDLKIDSSTVVRIVERVNTALLSFSVGIQKIQVSVEASYEHPFYVFGQGWSSCSPMRTLQRYGLVCKKLVVGDVCISLTLKSDLSNPTFNLNAAAASNSGNQNKLMTDRCLKSKSVPVDSKTISENEFKKRRWSAPEDIVENPVLSQKT